MNSRVITKSVVVALAIAALAAGCSQQDFGRPHIYKGHSFGAPDFRTGTPGSTNKGSIVEARSERLAKALSAWNQQAGRKQEDYLLGAGDELDVSIYALEAPDQTTHLKRTIGTDGQISLPWIANIKAVGVTIREFENSVKAAYSGRLLKNPQVTVQISKYGSVAVVITGAVRSPGMYYLSDNKITVLEMLAKAGGLSDEAADNLLVMRAGPGAATGKVAAASTRVATNAPKAGADVVDPTLLAKGGKLISISLPKLVDEGDLSLNVALAAGDVVTVRQLAKRFVYVLGYVQHPGSFELPAGQKVDAVKAVALAGGLGTIARAENSFLVRETPQGNAVFAVNLDKMATGSIPPLYIEPGDTLVVGSGVFAKLSEFVRPSAGTALSYTPSIP
jgi:polysaccharide biosynthesis/export protein